MKKVIALLLALLMVFSLAACAGKAENAPSAAPAEQAAAESTEKQPEAAPAEEAEEPAEEPAIVTWYTYGAAPEDLAVVLEDLNEKLKEKINVVLDLQFIESSEYNDKMKLASTSGDDYDIAWTSDWKNSFSANMTREAFMPLDDLLEEYGQDIIANCPSWVLDYGRVNGVLYAIPNLQIMAKIGAVSIQKEYADEYGWTKTCVDSMEEFYPFFDWVKENHPDKVPFSYDLGTNIFVPFKWETINDYAYINTEDPSTIVPVTEADKDWLSVYRYWFDQGYLREDMASVEDPSDDRTTLRYACLLTTGGPECAASQTNRYGKEFISVDIGDTGYLSATAGQSTMNAINVNAKNPEAAIKLLNLLWSDKEIFNELLFGIEGVHYTKTGDTTVEPVEDTKYSLSSSAWKYANQFDAWTFPGQDEDIWQQIEKFNSDATQSDNLGFSADVSEYQTEIAQLSSVMAEYKNGIFTCDDLDAYLAERNEKLEKAGLQTLIDGLQAQLDAWRAANGK